MSLPPVIERELRVAFRKHRPIKSRVKLTAILAGVTFLFILIDEPKQLHFVLFLAGLFLVMKTLRICAGLFSEERRNETLELLFLTGMTSQQLFATKLAGGLVVASSNLLALIPFLAIPFLAGGLSIQLFAATLVCLPTLLLFMAAVGVLASVSGADDGAAMMIAIGILAVLCLLTPVPYNLGLTLTGRAPFSSFWLSLSPAYAPWLVGVSFGASFPPNFWPCIGMTLMWTAVCLTTGAALLNRNWRNDPGHSASKWRQAWQAWVHGTNEWRAALRRSLLSHNAFQWRLEQDRRPMTRAWITVYAAVVLWIIGWIAWRGNWLSTINFFAAATLLFLALFWLQIYSAAQQIARERRDGTLELLLTTSLSPDEIVEAQLDASARQFHKARRGALAFFLVMMVLGFFVRQWNTRAVVVYVMIWAILCWVIMAKPRRSIDAAIWVALNSGRATYSLARFNSSASPFIWFWVIFNFYRASASFGNSAAQFPKGTVGELIVVSVIAVIVLLAGVVQGWNESPIWYLLRRHMREIAQEPVPDPDDPRFKKWKDIKQPFPSAAP